MDMRDYSPDLLLRLDGATKEYKQMVFDKIMKLRLAYGIEKSMHKYDIDIPMDKLDLFWKEMCMVVLYEGVDTVLDYAAKLRKEWGCNTCQIYPCDPSACAASKPLNELLTKIGEPKRLDN